MDSALSWMQSGLVFNSYKSDSDTWNGMIHSWKYCSQILGTFVIYPSQQKSPRAVKENISCSLELLLVLTHPKTKLDEKEHSKPCQPSSWALPLAVSWTHGTALQPVQAPILYPSPSCSSWQVAVNQSSSFLCLISFARMVLGKRLPWSVFSIAVLCPSAGLHSTLMQISGNL